MAIDYQLLRGRDISQRLDEFAELRLTVFNEFPYLYEGNLNYEKKYLQRYIDSPGSLLALALKDGQTVGATTCIPLADEADEIKRPFIDKNFNLSEVFYFGESIIFKEHRGQGIGSKFFDIREQHARQVLPRLKWTTFCAVIRPTDHPRRPADYVPLDQFWRKRGYSPREDMTIHYSWQDIGHTDETAKPLRVWLKPWT